ncbi:MAG: hypothetical protein ACP5QG_08370 [candidate division WOR-3 bacterium]
MCTALGFLAHELRAQDTLSFSLIFNEADYEIVVYEGYDRIVPKRDRLFPIGNPGEPELLAYSANFIIPPGKVVTEVILREVKMKQISGTYNIYPVGFGSLDKGEMLGQRKLYCPAGYPL